MDLPPSPVLKVFYTVQDVSTGDLFPSSGEFISGLHHRSWIVQINRLKKQRRNDLEKLLSIFDQSNLTDLRFILNVDEESFPEKYRIIIRRLRKAMEDPQKRREMELEEDVVNELQDLERQIEQKENIIGVLNQTIDNKDQTIADQAQALADKDQALAELKKELAKYQIL